MRNWNGEERRKCPRYSFSADVLLGLQDDSGKSRIQCHGHCENISLRGICIKISLKYREIKEKTKLQVKIPVCGTSQPLELIGQVTWRSQDEKSSRVGIQFLPNNNKGKEVFLFQFVESIKRKGYDYENSYMDK
ncbi:PilZ domain-containing protein [bacterium]|nr:PilZ domain-containing protein [bacterium]